MVCLRAVREKLSRGLYSVCVSLHSGLGGPALCWSRLKEQHWTGVTEPVEHHGRICDIELLINQNLHMVREHKTRVINAIQTVYKHSIKMITGTKRCSKSPNPCQCTILINTNIDS